MIKHTLISPEKAQAQPQLKWGRIKYSGSYSGHTCYCWEKAKPVLVSSISYDQNEHMLLRDDKQKGSYGPCC